MSYLPIVVVAYVVLWIIGTPGSDRPESRPREYRPPAPEPARRPPAPEPADPADSQPVYYDPALRSCYRQQGIFRYYEGRPGF